MEYMADSLQSRMNRPISDESKLVIVLGMFHAVAYLHKSEILHRDVKPGNILLDGEDRVKLCDFGSAKLLPHGWGITRDMNEGGWTEEYAAKDDKWTLAFDVFSCGKVMETLGMVARPLDAEWKRVVRDCQLSMADRPKALVAFRRLALVGLGVMGKSERLVKLLKELPAIGDDDGVTRSEFLFLTSPRFRRTAVNGLLGLSEVSKMEEIRLTSFKLDRIDLRVDAVTQEIRRVEQEIRAENEATDPFFDRLELRFSPGKAPRGAIATLRAMERNRTFVTLGLSSNDPGRLFGHSQERASVVFSPGSVMDLIFERPISAQEFDALGIQASSGRIVERLGFFRIGPDGEELEIVSRTWKPSTDNWVHRAKMNTGEWSSSHFRLRCPGDGRQDVIAFSGIDFLLKGESCAVGNPVRIVTTYGSLEKIHVWPPVRQGVATTRQARPALAIEFHDHELLARGVALDTNPGMMLVFAAAGGTSLTEVGKLGEGQGSNPVYLPIVYGRPENVRFYSQFELRAPRLSVILSFHYFDMYGELRVKQGADGEPGQTRTGP
jgi:hypothetical protein